MLVDVFEVVPLLFDEGVLRFDFFCLTENLDLKFLQFSVSEINVVVGFFENKVLTAAAAQLQHLYDGNQQNYDNNGNHSVVAHCRTLRIQLE